MLALPILARLMLVGRSVVTLRMLDLVVRLVGVWFCIALRRCAGCLTLVLRSILHSPHDVVIAGAAAEVAFEPVPDLGFARLRVVLEQLDRGHDHAGRAEATLQTMHLPEALLDRIIFTIGRQSFDGFDLGAAGLDREHGAALDAASVK